MVGKKYIKISVATLSVTALVIGLSVGISKSQKKKKNTNVDTNASASLAEYSTYDNSCASPYSGKSGKSGGYGYGSEGKSGKSGNRALYVPGILEAFGDKTETKGPGANLKNQQKKLRSNAALINGNDFDDRRLQGESTDDEGSEAPTPEGSIPDILIPAPSPTPKPITPFPTEAPITPFPTEAPPPDINGEDGTGFVEYYDGFLSPDEWKQYVETIEKSAEHPAAEASYNHIKVGASLGNRMKQLLIPSYTPTSNDNDNNDIMLQTRSIYESTRRHIDHYLPDHNGIRKVVEDRVAFVFLTDNESAKFNAGGKSISAVAGRLVTFRGNIVHGTTIKNKHVHLLGPFAVNTFAGVGGPPVDDPCPFCPDNGVTPGKEGITVTLPEYTQFGFTIPSVTVTCNEIATNPIQCGNVDDECLNFAGGTKNACDDAELICCPAVTTTTSKSGKSESGGKSGKSSCGSYYKTVCNTYSASSMSLLGYVGKSGYGYRSSEGKSGKASYPTTCYGYEGTQVPQEIEELEETTPSPTPSPTPFVPLGIETNSPTSGGTTTVATEKTAEPTSDREPRQ